MVFLEPEDVLRGHQGVLQDADQRYQRALEEVQIKDVLRGTRGL